MKTILLANPDIDVVLGADTVVLGALSARREAGKARPDQFLGGIDGEPAAVAEIRSGVMRSWATGLSDGACRRSGMRRTRPCRSS